MSEIKIKSTDGREHSGEYTVVVSARTPEGVEIRGAVLCDGEGKPIQSDSAWSWFGADNVEMAVARLADEHGWSDSRAALIEAEIREAAQFDVGVRMRDDMAAALTAEIRRAVGFGTVVYEPVDQEYVIWPEGRPYTRAADVRAHIHRSRQRTDYVPATVPFGPRHPLGTP